MKLFEKLEGLAYNIGKFTADKLESAVDLVPERARPKARKALEIAKREAKKAFDKSTATRQFLENLGYRMALNGMSKAVMFFLTLWLTRVLSPDEFGLYSFTISTTMLLAILSTLGVPTAMMKVVPSQIKGNKKYLTKWLSNGLAVVTISSVVLFALLLFFKDYLAIFIFNKPEIGSAIVLIGMFTLVYSIAVFFDSFFISLKRNDLSLKSGILREVSKLFLIVLLVSVTFSYFGAVFGYVGGLLFFIIAAILNLGNYNVFFNDKLVTLYNLKTIIDYSKWFLVLGLSMTLLSRVDILMISIMMPIQYVGYYQVVTSIIASIVFLFPIGHISFPILSESKTARDLNIRWMKLIYFVLMISFVIVLPLVLLAKPLLDLLYPPLFAENGWLPLTVLSFLVPLKYLFWINSQRLIILDKKKLQLGLIIFAVGLNLLLDYITIPLFGLTGAAVSSVIALLASTLVGYSISNYLK